MQHGDPSIKRFVRISALVEIKEVARSEIFHQHKTTADVAAMDCRGGYACVPEQPGQTDESLRVFLFRRREHGDLATGTQVNAIKLTITGFRSQCFDQIGYAAKRCFEPLQHVGSHRVILPVRKYCGYR